MDYDNPLGAGGHDCDMTTKFFERYFEMPMYDQYIQQFDGISVVNYESQRTIAKENFNSLEFEVIDMQKNIKNIKFKYVNNTRLGIVLVPRFVDVKKVVSFESDKFSEVLENMKNKNRK